MIKSEIKIQANSFCPFVEECPDLSYSECGKCLLNIIEKGIARKISARDSRMPSRV